MDEFNNEKSEDQEVNSDSALSENSSTAETYTDEDGTKTEQAVIEQPFSLGKEVFEWVYTIAIALIIAFVVKAFIFDVVKVDGSSMYPTLQNNDRLVVTKLGYKPKQGDIIILDSTYVPREAYIDELEKTKGHELSFFEQVAFKFNTPDYLKKRYYVKRVIALEGQTVDIKNGRVSVDGKILDEPYYTGQTYPIDSAVSFPLTVEEDMIFVMGDNRAHSKDSRSSELGQVPYEAVMGKSQLRIWPLNDMGLTK